VCIVCFSSCEYFTKKEVNNEQKLDSISFTSVDVSPSFKVCDSIFEKTKKEECFRATIYEKVTKSLASQKIKVKRDIDEVVRVIIIVHSNKDITLKSIEASQNVYAEIPDIKKMIEKSIEDLPKVFPATKRSIPVTTEYTLPIRIQLQN
jgi:chorismate mutase